MLRLLFLILTVTVLAASARAQPAGVPGPQWQLVVEGEAADWPLAASYPADSLDAVAGKVLADLQREGYYRARVDSAQVAENAVTLFVQRGPRVEVASIEVTGVPVAEAERWRTGFRTKPGQTLDLIILRRDLDGMLLGYERAGYPLATADLDTIELTDAGLALSVRAEPGPQIAVSDLELVPKGRTSARFAARVAGLETDGVRFDAGRIQRELEETGLFEEVGTPELALDAAGRATVRVPATERPPGTFDLVFGYLPPGSGEASGSVVGNGSLVLSNLFGRGRALALQLVRNPGLVSSLDVRVSDPYVLGLPLRVEGHFAGYQQDSTFQRQRYGIEVGYRFAPGLEGLVTASREYVDAGIAGIALVDGRQRIPEADAWFAGIGVRYRRTDSRLNPRRGLFLETLLEQGVKRRTLDRDTADFAAPVSVRQQRLVAAARLYVPTWRRQVLVAGGDAALLLGDVYDDSDLFRYGGAASLRGYDEEQFRGNAVGRVLFEYRYQIDRTSFAFLFTDIGYIRRPETPGMASDESVRPGYGLGIQYRTPLGLVTVSYALNPDDGPTRGKVHVGLSVGL